MIEAIGNIWDYKADCIVITTNGYVRQDGACVMGRGVALQAKRKFPGIEYRIGDAIRRQGNHLYNMGRVCTFPVKHYWYQAADLDLIHRSAEELAVEARALHTLTFVMPRPGCGNGRLHWSVVRPLIEKILPDNVCIIELPGVA